MDAPPMTDYFRDNVMLKRPYIKLEWCARAIAQACRREVQIEDGRVRYWVFIDEMNRYLRVVTLEDGVTLHNAFPDRRFQP
jgi:hypothetical protein